MKVKNRDLKIFSQLPTLNFQLKKGFTLIELLIVIAIIGILAVAILATINPVTQQKKAKTGRIQSDLNNFANAAEVYGTSCGTYGKSLGSSADVCRPDTANGSVQTGAATEAKLNSCIDYWTRSGLDLVRVSNSKDPDGDAYTGCCSTTAFCVEGKANGTYYQYKSANGRVTNSAKSDCSC